MAFWFGRKSAPEVRPYVPVWLAGETNSGEFVRGYRARLDEVSRRNPVGLRAVRLVAGLTGSLPLYSEEGDAKAVELVRAGRAPMILDELSSVTVQLVNEGQVLLNADTDAMASGANLAVIGEELIQFGRAEQLEPGLFRLSHLLRGPRGTEWAASTHEIGERFCLFNSAALASIDLPASATGAALRVISHGIADSAPLPEAQRAVSGEAMRPPPVCHLRAWRAGASVHLSWIRRSHRGWAWNDGVGVPADSFPERYRLTVTGPEGQLELECDEPGAIFDSASLPAMAGQMVEIEVRTIGPMALSRPQLTSLTL